MRTLTSSLMTWPDVITADGTHDIEMLKIFDISSYMPLLNIVGKSGNREGRRGGEGERERGGEYIQLERAEGRRE